MVGVYISVSRVPHIRVLGVLGVLYIVPLVVRCPLLGT
jgi:hypothetical protein